MSEIKTIDVRKQVLVSYRGLGLTNKEISERLGITPGEVADALAHFGITKGKAPKKGYTINYIDDLSLSDLPGGDQTEAQPEEEPEPEAAEAE